MQKMCLFLIIKMRWQENMTSKYNLIRLEIPHHQSKRAKANVTMSYCYLIALLKSVIYSYSAWDWLVCEIIYYLYDLTMITTDTAINHQFDTEGIMLTVVPTSYFYIC